MTERKYQAMIADPPSTDPELKDVFYTFCSNVFCDYSDRQYSKVYK